MGWLRRSIAVAVLAATLAGVAPWGGVAYGQSIVWMRQFGTTGDDVATGVAVDGSGNVYVAGYTSGALGRASLGSYDAFLRKYDRGGNVLWTRQFGSTDPMNAAWAEDKAYAVAVDSSGNIYVAGSAQGALPGQTRTSYNNEYAFIRKYTPEGSEAWTREFGAGSMSYVVATAVTVNGAGQVYLAGYTNGALPGQSRVGLALREPREPPQGPSLDRLRNHGAEGPV